MGYQHERDQTDMLIRWYSREERTWEVVPVLFLQSDDFDPEMPLKVRFPDGHPMRGTITPDDDGGVWLTRGEFEVLEGIQ